MNHRPRKRFGQHFLHDGAVIARIVRAIGPRSDQALLEIGPGTGALTAPLLAAAGALDVIEVDRDLAARLRESAPADGSLRVHGLDALQLQLGQLQLPPGRQGRWRVVGNLPYNITSPLLFHLLGQLDHIQGMVFMVQRELAERMCATEGGADYGRLSVMVQAACKTTLLFGVGPGAFRPPPRVDSAVIALSPRPERPCGAVLQALDTLARRAFGQRRKTLRNALSGCLDMGVLEALDLDPGWRAQQLRVEDFLRLAGALARADADGLPPPRQKAT